MSSSDSRPYIAFAPLQGHTDAAYRRAHCEAAGGVAEYYAPFVRIEGGGLRNKDRRDIDPEANRGVPVVPQVIARDRDEFARLCDLVQQMGWRRIDLNMGCPFPMQARRGRGSGLLPHPDRVAAIVAEMGRRPEVCFSVKMRLGQESADEGLRLLPILNEAPLAHITLHPRVGRQQYRGTPDRDAFARFGDGCRLPVVYNGDLASTDDIEALLRQFPQLKGVMLGRGLLAQPWLLGGGDPQEVVARLHARLFDHALRTLQGETQIIARMKAFWEYPPPFLDHKTHKMIIKSTRLCHYREAVARMGGGLLSVPADGAARNDNHHASHVPRPWK